MLSLTLGARSTSGDERTLALDLLDGVDQRIGIGRQDDQRVDTLGLKILHGIGLRSPDPATS